jgi:Uma2 family endonuclease
MSLETTEPITSIIEPPEWQPPMPPTDLIFDDGEPLESNRHREAMNLLIHSVNSDSLGRSDFFAGGNMFIYYSSKQVRNRDFRGPDFFVVLGVDNDKSRPGWVVWEENGRYPDVIVEMLSDSTAHIDLGVKKTLYQEVFKTRDYFVFEPHSGTSFQGWHLDVDLKYQPITPNEQGWLWCETLKLWLGTWVGSVNGDETTWLRFYDPEGNLVFLSAEAERQRADTERQRADTEQQRADTEQQRAEAERQRADRLAARLQELGIEE